MSKKVTFMQIDNNLSKNLPYRKDTADEIMLRPYIRDIDRHQEPPCQ